MQSDNHPANADTSPVKCGIENIISRCGSRHREVLDPAYGQDVDTGPVQDKAYRHDKEGKYNYLAKTVPLVNIHIDNDTNGSDQPGGD